MRGAVPDEHFEISRFRAYSGGLFLPTVTIGILFNATTFATIELTCIVSLDSTLTTTEFLHFNFTIPKYHEN